jgi:hypothetical protein
LIGLLKQSLVETKLVKISLEQYRELEEKGFYTGWKQCGSLYLAQTKERLHYLKRWVPFKRTICCSSFSLFLSLQDEVRGRHPQHRLRSGRSGPNQRTIHFA